MMSVPDLKVLVWSVLPIQDVGSKSDMFCTVVRCRTLGWLSRLVNADFGRSCRQPVCRCLKFESRAEEARCLSQNLDRQA